MKYQRGFSTTEYVIVGLVIVWVFLLPMGNIPPFNGRTIFVTLIDVMQKIYADFAYGVGLPRFR
jgi:hypothetical protein